MRLCDSEFYEVSELFRQTHLKTTDAWWVRVFYVDQSIKWPDSPHADLCVLYSVWL